MKKVRGKIFHFNDEVWTSGILVGVGVRYETALKRYCALAGVDPFDDKINPGVEARTLAIGNIKNCLLWFKDRKPAPDLIAHEAVHASYYLLKLSGLRFTDRTEEAFAYHVAWLVREIGRRIG